MNHWYNRPSTTGSLSVCHTRHAAGFFAFGDRSLHIDLSFGHPLVRQSSQRPSYSHCGLGAELQPDKSLPKRWDWFGCVCHRCPPRRLGFESERDLTHLPTTPQFDVCTRKGHLCQCVVDGTVVTRSGDCFVGAMGWLRTCRQAYVKHQ